MTYDSARTAKKLNFTFCVSQTVKLEIMQVFCSTLILYLYFFPQLNLASQSVLEGLNACFDHRAEIYVPELGMNFHVQHKMTKIFGCQNPYRQGGGRKGLPKSFLNRFTQVSLFV